ADVRVSHTWACLLGQPVAHSLSPALHNAAFCSVGIDAHYEAWDVAPQALGEAVARLRTPECMGANVTAPHKQAVVAYMDEVSEEVLTLGVLNTIVNQAGRLVGANTDARGLARWMRRVEIEAAGRRAVGRCAGREWIGHVAAPGRAGIRAMDRPRRADGRLRSSATAGSAVVSLGYLRVVTAGESHGPQLTIFVENLPAGMPVLAEDID